MKLTFISNACCIYQSGDSTNSFRLLADPWLVPGAFGSWTHNPPITTKPEDLLDVDALYISHIHPDHCDPETLKHFRRDIPIYTLKDRLSLCAKHLAKMGFTDIIAMADRESLGPDPNTGPFKLTMFGPFTKHPFHDCEIGNVVDSALLIEHEGRTVLNANDNTPSLAAAEWLGREYGPIHLAQLNYNSAGPYPACFINLAPHERILEGERMGRRHLEHAAAVAKAMQAERVQPFAGAYKLMGQYEHLNKHLGLSSAKWAESILKGKGLDVVTFAEGETCVV